MRKRVYKIKLTTPHDDGDFDNEDVENFIYTALGSEPGLYPPEDPRAKIRVEGVEVVK